MSPRVGHWNELIPGGCPLNTGELIESSLLSHSLFPMTSTNWKK